MLRKGGAHKMLNEQQVARSFIHILNGCEGSLWEFPFGKLSKKTQFWLNYRIQLFIIHQTTRLVSVLLCHPLPSQTSHQIHRPTIRYELLIIYNKQNTVSRSKKECILKTTNDLKFTSHDLRSTMGSLQKGRVFLLHLVLPQLRHSWLLSKFY